MVGVPRFVRRCDCGPSSRIGWPLPCLRRNAEMIAGPNQNTNNSAVAVAPPVRKVMYRKTLNGLNRLLNSAR